MLENFLYSIIHFFSEIGLKGFIALSSMIGGTFLFIFVARYYAKKDKENSSIGERATKSAGITAGGILFGLLVCAPVSIYTFEKFSEPKVIIEGKNAELIRVCMKTAKEINDNSFYLADLNCSKIAERYGSKDICLFKQRVKIALIVEQARQKEAREKGI